MHSTRRLFIGLALPEDVAGSLHAAARAAFATEDVARLKFSAAVDLHLTLVFLGAVAEAAIPKLTSSLAENLREALALDLELAGTGAFPSFARPRVLFAGVRAVGDAGGGLEAVREPISSAVREAGLTLSAREIGEPFRPHVTLARARSPIREAATRGFQALELRAGWRAEEVALFESVGERVPRYPRIARFALIPSV
jgi:2'-5' RNA ligase